MTQTNERAWYEESGPRSGLVLASRVRLARNLSDTPFPNRLNPLAIEHLCERISERFFAANSNMRQDFDEVILKDLTQAEASAMVEKHLISEELFDKRNCTRVLISKDQSKVIMLGEEDHIRIQCITSGMDLESCYQEAERLAEMFEELLPIAYSEDYGFLTACPTNTGTGLRASYMVHLPALTESGVMVQMVQSLNKLGIAVRGAYGEGSKPKGGVYQISNQTTLGFSEQDLISDLTQTTEQVMAKESQFRKAYYQGQPLATENRVYRALALLKHSRMMTHEEALNLIAEVRVGLDLGILQKPKIGALNKLTALTGPAAIEAVYGPVKGIQGRDEARATLIRETIAQYKPLPTESIFGDDESEEQTEEQEKEE